MMILFGFNGHAEISNPATAGWSLPRHSANRPRLRGEPRPPHYAGKCSWRYWLARSCLVVVLFSGASPTEAQETIEDRLNAGGKEWHVSLDCAGLFGAFDMVETDGNPMASVTRNAAASYAFQILAVRQRFALPANTPMSEITRLRSTLNPEISDRIGYYRARATSNMRSNGHLYRGDDVLTNDVSFCIATMGLIVGHWPFGRP